MNAMRHFICHPLSVEKKFSFKILWAILKEAVSEWWSKDPFRESATIAYYAIFSIPALLAIIRPQHIIPQKRKNL